MKQRSLTVLSLAAVAFLAALAPNLHAANSFVRTDLVSDLPGANHLDPNLANPWGLAFSATGPFWVADNKTGVSTIYNSAGEPQSLVVTVPPAGGSQPPSAPTGIVFNGGSGFEVSAGHPARFIFATEDGTISGWEPSSGNNAIRKVDNSTTAAYKGLAIGGTGAQARLYAANFAQNRVEAFDAEYAPATLSGSFTDPNLPAGYAPFNVENIGGKLYVTYALRDPQSGDDQPGAGNGIVNVFDLEGNLERRLISAGPLNSPWGITIASPDFGAFGNDLLVGNFGDGRINAFDPLTGNFLGALNGPDGQPLEIDGLWALKFGNGGNGGETDDLYFTAGIQDEQHGVFGEIAVAVPDLGANTAALLLIGLVALRPCMKREKERLSLSGPLP